MDKRDNDANRSNVPDDNPQAQIPEPAISHDEAFRRFKKTRQAEGGIKAQSRRGKMARTWWAARWIATLESFQIGARLDRGRSYARKGQVLDIDIEKGNVSARVQGSRKEPYKITIKVNELSKGDWTKLSRVFAGKAIFAAKLLVGQMPDQIEEAFKEVQLSLFPAREAELRTDCSCPDWSNPCKHIAAVYYLLGEEFDRDPFLIFKLRGITRDELLDLLDEALSVPKKTGPSSNVVALGEHSLADAIPSAHHGFWKTGALPSDLLGDYRVPDATCVLARRLGPFPFWRGESDFWQTMERMYRIASSETLKSADRSGGITKRPDRSF